jgi:hypothetical protein
LRNILAVAISTAVYYTLLSFVYSNAPYTSPPQWWGIHSGSGPTRVISWFTLLNVGGALLSAIPVAIGLVFACKVRRIRSAVVVGFLAALVIVVGGLNQYGLPRSGGTWFADVVQFLGICGAVVGAVALIEGLPSNKSLERTRER